MTSSMSKIVKWVFIGTLVTGALASDDGDDFSNNLFSDLAPLLALFGERVTMQFMSQSVGWADNIILAMAPIGIITAIVASIRVGGPPWLKAVIGRARENLAVSEVELMSSTSKEVCEVWNGQEVVRCMGLAPVVEFICLLHFADAGQSENQPVPTIEVLRLEEAITKGYIKDLDGGEMPKTTSTSEGDEEQGNPTLNRRPTADSNSMATKVKRLQKICIIRDTSGDSPNIILNCHPSANKWELWLFAVFGTILQLGVLAYSGFATYHPALKFQKDDKPIESYAYPCTAIGTLVLVIGMLLCGHVVESSTDEKRYGAVAEWKARMVWLQQTKTVSDQVFNSYMVYAKDDQQTIITSRRSNRHGKDRSTTTYKSSTAPSDNDPSTFLNVVTITGTGITLCGFVLQFVGLRGMHWSASIAQLGAVLAMVCVKAWVRRGLAKSPECEPLPSGFELDLFTRTLGGIMTEAWSGGKGDDNGPVNTEISRGTKTPRNEWRVVTGGSSSLKVSEPNQVSAPEPSDGSVFDAQALLNARKSLAQLASWRGPASAEAVSLARAIECTLDAMSVCIPENPQNLTWDLETRYSGPKEQKISIPISRQVTGWKVDASLIEAILSLWLSSVEEEELSQDKDSLSNVTDGIKHQKQKHQDDWLRSKGTIAKQSLRLFGRRTPSLVRDLLWWVPKDLLSVFQIQEDQVESLRGALQIDEVESQSDDSEIDTKTVDILGNEFYQSLKALYAIDLFSSFTRAVAKAMDTPIPGGAEEIQSKSDKDDASWKIFTLRNNHLSKMIQNIHNTGLGSLDQIYLSVITPLSQEKRLPKIDAVVNLALQRSRRNERSEKWEEAGNDLIWLFRLANRTFSSRGNVVSKATANLMEHLRLLYLVLSITMERNFELMNYKVVNVRHLRTLSIRVQRELEAADLELRRFLERKQRLLVINGNTSSYQDARKAANRRLKRINDARGGPRDILERTPIHYIVFASSPKAIRMLNNSHHDINSQDLLGLTALHYVCLTTQRLEVAQHLIDRGAELNILARDGATPLHYASMRGDVDKARVLIQSGATVDIWNLAGRSPLHMAAVHGHAAMVEYLWAKARPDLRDRWSWTVLHLAAMHGSDSVVELLVKLKDDKEAKDRRGRTALHLASMTGREKVVAILVDEGADTNAIDNYRNDALMLAVQTEKIGVVRLLINRMKDTPSTEIHHEEPLAVALMDGQKDVSRLLMENGVNYDWKDALNHNLLHYASMGPNNTDLIEEFLDLGFDINSKGDGNRTPLHVAIQHSETFNVKCLLQKGADVNQPDDCGWTPLWFATDAKKVHLVQLLLDNDASTDISSTDPEPQTLLSMAEEGGNEEIINLIRRYQTTSMGVSQDTSHVAESSTTP
ncbi:hypothetical protein HYE68_002702 [Fusarium pseudograminearum]|nr:hypothetical protein HYE68_002702 [Fusarium pseudograminearum]